MKTILLLFSFLLLPLTLFSQKIDSLLPSFTNKEIYNLKKEIKNYMLPYVDIEAELRELDDSRRASIVRLGERINIDILKTANKYDVGNGYLYIFKMKAKKALNILLHYRQFFLAEGASFFIYGEDRNFYSVTSKSNRSDLKRIGEVINGNQLTLELFESKNTKNSSKIIIDTIIHGV
ncbi:MAG: hypothetical protein R3E32_14275 [Chitinophagales bacterium]